MVIHWDVVFDNLLALQMKQCLMLRVKRRSCRTGVLQWGRSHLSSLARYALYFRIFHSLPSSCLCMQSCLTALQSFHVSCKAFGVEIMQAHLGMCFSFTFSMITEQRDATLGHPCIQP